MMILMVTKILGVIRSEGVRTLMIRILGVGTLEMRVTNLGVDRVITPIYGLS